MKSVNLDKVNRVTFVKIVPEILFPRERLNLGLSCVRDNGNITRPRLHLVVRANLSKIYRKIIIQVFERFSWLK